MLDDKLVKKAEWFSRCVRLTSTPVPIPSEILQEIDEDKLPEFYQELRRNGLMEDPPNGGWRRKFRYGK